jgi:hypothetical protein
MVKPYNFDTIQASEYQVLTVLWVRISIKLKGKIRIRIKVISWIWIRIITWQMTCQKVLNRSPFKHFFKDLSLYLEAGIRILIK